MYYWHLDDEVKTLINEWNCIWTIQFVRIHNSIWKFYFWL